MGQQKSKSDIVVQSGRSQFRQFLESMLSCAQYQNKDFDIFESSFAKNRLHRQDLLLENKTEKKGMKTLILDLDETLIHSKFNGEDCNYDHMIEVRINNHNYNFYIKFRPGLFQFLKKMSQIYEVVVFTASLKQVIYINQFIFNTDDLLFDSMHSKWLSCWILNTIQSMECQVGTTVFSIEANISKTYLELIETQKTQQQQMQQEWIDKLFNLSS